MIIVFDIFEGLLGIVGLIGYFVLALTTNYGNIGLASIRVGVGVISIIVALFFAGLNLLEFFSQEKKKISLLNIWGLIQIVLIIALVIYSYCNPYYSERFNIVFSPMMSAFGRFAWIYFGLVFFHYLIEAAQDSDFGSLGMLFIIWFIAALVSNAIVFLIYLFGSRAMLDNNFHYENRRALEIREEEYKSTEFKEVFPQIFEHEKKYWIGEQGESQEEFKEKIVNDFNEQFKVLKCNDDISNPNITTCRFKDKSSYDESNKQLIYYATIDFSNNTVLNTYMKDEYKLVKLESKDDISGFDALDYAVWKVVSGKEEINVDNINKALKNLKVSFVCNKVEDYKDDQVKVTIAKADNPDDISSSSFDKETGKFKTFFLDGGDTDATKSIATMQNDIQKSNDLKEKITVICGIIVAVIVVIANLFIKKRKEKKADSK